MEAVMLELASATADSTGLTVHYFNVTRPVRPKEFVRMEHASVHSDSVVQLAVK